MWTPIVSAALSVAASVHGHTDRRTGAHRGRDVIYAAAGLTGHHRHGLSPLQHHQEAGRALLAKPVLLGADRRAGSPVAVRPDGFPVGAGARQPTRHAANGIGHTGRAGGRGADRRLAARNDGRGRPAAFPRRLTTIRLCCCRFRCRRSRQGLLVNAALGAVARAAALHPLVAARHDDHGSRRGRVPRLWRLAQHGRLAELAAERLQRDRLCPHRLPSPGLAMAGLAALGLLRGPSR